MTSIVPGEKYEYKDKNETYCIEVMNYIDNVVYKHYTASESGGAAYGKPEEISLQTFQSLVASGYFKKMGD